MAVRPVRRCNSILMSSPDVTGSDKATLDAHRVARRAIPDGRMLEFLVCPVTRGPLQYDAAAQELISRSARLAYPIRDGIAIMVPSEARHLDDHPSTIIRRDRGD
jgi:uncharacterized protein